MTFRAIQADDSANGFSGWIEFEAASEDEAWNHAENVFGSLHRVSVEEI